MKIKNLLSIGAFAMLGTGFGWSQSAKVQVIHNSADAAAATVDVWLTIGNNPSTLLLDNFAFRTATSFVDLAAGTPLKFGIAPSNSMMVTDTIANFDLTLTANEKYVVVANGIVSPTGYNPAPAFNLEVFAGALETGSNASNTDLLVFHGSTDAPTVDVVEVGAGAGLLVDNLAYATYQGYLSVPTADYALQIRTAEGNSTVVQYSAPLSTLNLQGAAGVVVASGFLDPSQNSNGAAFGLYVALPSGGPLVALPTQAISTARVQVIHNSADLAASVVDVWLNDALLLDNFAFRSASPFIDAPAGTPFDVTIQPSTSTDTTNGLARFTYTLTGGEKYILVANGIVSPSGYSPATPFDIYVTGSARELASTPGNVDVLVFHGSTDAPTVDVTEIGIPAGLIVDDASYGDFAGYLSLSELDYQLQISVASSGAPVVTYSAPLQTLGLGDQAITVLASGFLDPAQNSSGPAFGLYVALPTGGNLVPLSVVTSVDDVTSKGTIAAFPNPSNGSVNLLLPEVQGGKLSVNVRDLSGALLQTEEFHGGQTVEMNLNGFQAGIYMIEAQTETGLRYTTKVSLMK